MTAKTVLIAKVLPFCQKDDKFIEIKVRKLGNLNQFSDNIKENMMNEKTKRKRERLDHLSDEEKLKRRKLHNRAAAQSARDRKKVQMNELQKTVECLKKQKILLQSSNESLITRFKELERENSELKLRLSKMEIQSTIGDEDDEGFVGSAELINVSQPQKHETSSRVPQSMTPFLYWLAIMNLMQSLNFSTPVLNNFSKQTSIQQKNQIPSQLTTERTIITCPNWSLSKT